MSVALSVIVPAFNAIDYLEDCITSIIGGSYRNFEIILIDDGSTDGTSELCDSLKEKYAEIRVFHTENHGISSARNLGLENAAGKFIGFVDSDDTVSPNMFEALVHAMISGVQLAACQFVRCVRNVVPNADTEPLQYITTNQVGAAAHILRGSYGPYVWNKLYRKDILDANSIRFLINSQGAEDQFFNASYLQYCEKATFLNQKMYNYITTGGSITSTFRTSRTVSNSYISLPKSWRYTAEVMADISPDLRVWAQARATMFYQTVLRKIENPDKQYVGEAIEYVKQNKATLLHYKWGFKYYLSAIVLSASYPLWAKIFRRRLPV